MSIIFQTLVCTHVALSWKYLHWLDHHFLFLFFFRNSLEEYFKDNRNIKKHKDPCKSVMRESWHEKSGVKDPIIGHKFMSVPVFAFLPHTVLRMQLLKHTKCDIVNCLSVLPKTQHDFNSYVVDLCVQTVSTHFLPQAGLESSS